MRQGSIMTAEINKEVLRRNPVADWVSAAIEFIRVNRAVALGVVTISLAGALGFGAYAWYQERQEADGRRALIAASAKLRTDKPGETASRDEALKLLQGVATAHGGTLAAEEALVRIGNYQYEAQKFDEALGTAAKYLQQYPRGRYRMMVAISKAYAEEGKGNPDAAIQTLLEITAASKEDPLAGEALLNLGRLYETQKKKDEALKIYGQVAERYPNSQWGQIALQRMGRVKSGQ